MFSYIQKFVFRNKRQTAVLVATLLLLLLLLLRVLNNENNTTIVRRNDFRLETYTENKLLDYSNANQARVCIIIIETLHEHQNVPNIPLRAVK